MISRLRFALAFRILKNGVQFARGEVFLARASVAQGVCQGEVGMKLRIAES